MINNFVIKVLITTVVGLIYFLILFFLSEIKQHIIRKVFTHRRLKYELAFTSEDLHFISWTFFGVIDYLGCFVFFIFFSNFFFRSLHFLNNILIWYTFTCTRDLTLYNELIPTSCNESNYLQRYSECSYWKHFYSYFVLCFP